MSDGWSTVPCGMPGGDPAGSLRTGLDRQRSVQNTYTIRLSHTDVLHRLLVECFRDPKVELESSSIRPIYLHDVRRAA